MLINIQLNAKDKSAECLVFSRAAHSAGSFSFPIAC